MPPHRSYFQCDDQVYILLDDELAVEGNLRLGRSRCDYSYQVTMNSGAVLLEDQDLAVVKFDPFSRSALLAPSCLATESGER